MGKKNNYRKQDVILEMIHLKVDKLSPFTSPSIEIWNEACIAIHTEFLKQGLKTSAAAALKYQV